MSTATDILGAVKKILLLSEDMERLKAKVEDISRQVADHEHRLIRLETVMQMATQPRRIHLPGE